MKTYILFILLFSHQSLAQLQVPTGDASLDAHHFQMISKAETFILDGLEESAKKLGLECNSAKARVEVYLILEIEYPRKLKKCVDQMIMTNSKVLSDSCRKIVYPIQIGHNFSTSKEVINGIESKSNMELKEFSKELAEQTEEYLIGDDFAYDADVYGCTRKANGQEYFIFSRGIIGQNSRLEFEKRRSVK